MGLSLNNQFLLIAFNAISVAILLSWYAFRAKMAVTDESNERSLHQGKALTGAGIFMFLPLCVSIAVVFPDFLSGYLLLLMSLLGWVDDRYDLPFKPRLLIQIVLLAACLIYYDFTHPGWLLFLLIASVWWVNLFNFMDGANGMAGFHALVTLTFYAYVFYVHESLNFIIVAMMVILLIYLFFNVVIRKLFMGDSGSLPLAFLLVIMALWSIQSNWLNYWQVAMVHAAFIADATFTLVVRLYKRENITQAHASHLYQRLIKSGYSHVRVSLLYASVTALLCVMAIWAQHLNLVYQVSLLLISYIVLLAVFLVSYQIGRPVREMS